MVALTLWQICTERGCTKTSQSLNTLCCMLPQGMSMQGELYLQSRQLALQSADHR